MNTNMGGPSLNNYLRILVLISNPMGSLEDDVLTIPRFSLDVLYEWQLLVDSIEKNKDEITKKYPPIALVKINPPTEEEIRIKLSPQFNYQILHFIGHGDSSGIEVENEIGVSHYLKTEKIIEIIDKSELKLIYLNSCNSLSIARELIAKTKIQSVISTEDTVNDRLASFFAGKFYALLANGQSVKDAFSFTVSATIEELKTNSPYVLLGNEDWKLDFNVRVEKPLFLNMDPLNNLPLGDLGKHTCRSGQMIALAKASKKSRKVFNITGISGIGKTTFSLKYAQRYSSIFNEGIIYIDMGNMKTYKEIFLTFTYFIDSIDKLEVAKKITEGKFLIIIDNLEEADSQLQKDLLIFLAFINWQTTRSSLIFLTKKLYNKNELLHADTLVLDALEKEDIIAWIDKEHPEILNELRDLIDEFIEYTHGHPKIIQLSFRMFEYLSAKDVLSRLKKYEGKHIEGLIANIMNDILKHEDNILISIIMNILALSDGRARAKLLRYCIRRALNTALNDIEIDSAIETLFKLNYLRYYKLSDVYILHHLLTRYFKKIGSEKLENQLLDKIQRAMHSYLISEIHGPFVYTKESNANYISLFNWIAGAKADEFIAEFKQLWIDNYLLTLHYYEELEIRMLSGVGHYRKFSFHEVNKALNMEDRAGWLISPFERMRESLFFRDILQDEFYKDPEIQIGYYAMPMAKVYFSYENYLKNKGLKWDRRISICSDVSNIACNFKKMMEMINDITEHLIDMMVNTSYIQTENIEYQTLENIGFKFELKNIVKAERNWNKIIDKYQNVIDSHGLQIDTSDNPSNYKFIISFRDKKTNYQKAKLDYNKVKELRSKYGL